MNKQLTQEQQQLIQNHTDYAKRLAHKLNFIQTNQDDITSAALEGLCRAALAYDPVLGVQFSTLLFAHVRGSVISAIRELRGTETLSTDDGQLLSDDGEPLTTLPEPSENPYDHLDDTDLVRHLLDTLTPRDRLILSHLYGLEGHKELSPNDTAALLGIPPSLVHARHKTILKTLKSSTLLQNP